MVALTKGFAQEPVEYDSVIVDCLDLATPGPRQFVINSERDLESLKMLRRRFPMKYLPPGEKCSDLGAFDFRTKTLIGCVAQVGGCYMPTFDLNFYKQENEYLVEVLVGSSGGCRAMFTKDYWFLTDKIPDAELVHFEIEYR